MFIKKIYMNTFLRAVVLIILSNCSSTQALKCYVCEDCDSKAQLHELEVCGMPTAPNITGGAGSTPTSILSSFGTPAAPPPAAAAAGSVPTNGNSNESDYDSEDEYEDSSEDNDQQQGRPPQGGTGLGTTVGIMPALVNGGGAGMTASAGIGGGAGLSGVNAGAGTETGPGPISTIDTAAGTGTGTGTVVNTVPSAASAVPASEIGAGVAASSGVNPGMGVGVGALGESAEFSEEEEGEDDYENERRKRGIFQINGQRQYIPMSVCYIVRLSMNDTIITNRGCTTMLDDNREQACNSLFDGWNVEGCQLCESDECNQPINALGISSRFKNSALLLILSGYSVMYFV